MSWTLSFELRWRNGGPVPRSSRRKAGDVLNRCLTNAKNTGLVVLEPTEAEPLQGFVQIRLRDGCEMDFVLLLDALQGLARDEPGLLVTASDDFYLTGEDVLEVGDPRAVLEPDPTQGSGTFRTDPTNDVNRVYRAPRPKVDAQAVARSFLDRLTAKQLVEWVGPRDHAVEQLAGLVLLIEKGRWRGAAEVLQVLELDDAVAELFATDAELDDVWRQALSHA